MHIETPHNSQYLVYIIEQPPTILSYPELYLNPQGTPESFPSHFHMIPESSPSTLKYSWVSRVKPELVHLPPYTWIICIPLSLAPTRSLLRDFGIPALYHSHYILYTQNWHTSEFPSFQVHIPFHLLYILVPLLTPFGSSDHRFLRGSVTTTRHSHSSRTLPQNLVPLAVTAQYA